MNEERIDKKFRVLKILGFIIIIVNIISFLLFVIVVFPRNDLSAPDNLWLFFIGSTIAYIIALIFFTISFSFWYYCVAKIVNKFIDTSMYTLNKFILIISLTNVFYAKALLLGLVLSLMGILNLNDLLLNLNSITSVIRILQIMSLYFLSFLYIDQNVKTIIPVISLGWVPLYIFPIAVKIVTDNLLKI
jgi:hypothetical protein